MNFRYHIIFDGEFYRLRRYEDGYVLREAIKNKWSPDLPKEIGGGFYQIEDLKYWVKTYIQDFPFEEIEPYMNMSQEFFLRGAL